MIWKILICAGLVGIVVARIGRVLALERQLRAMEERMRRI